MFRFFILAIFFHSFVWASDFSSWPVFKEKHVDPFLSKGTDSTSVIILLSGALTVAATHNQDDRVRSEWKGYQKMDRDTANFGDVLGTGAFSLAVAGLQYKFDKDEHVYQSHLRGFFYGGLSIYTLKTIFARPRPGGSNNRQSFPSGHTAIMFMTAAHIQQAYGWWAASGIYALSVFTAASRLTDDVHWFSDTVGGAFLGTWVGRATFYERNNLSESNQKISFIPVIQSQQSGFVFLYRY